MAAEDPPAEQVAPTAPPPPADARRCENCGAKLRGRFCVACGQRARSYEQIRCENCGAEKQGLYCAVCGQNDRNYLRTIFPVIGEVLAETFETDSRLLVTVRVLFTRPGFLSAEFSRNRRARYLSPFRLYLFTSIVFFFALSFTIKLPEGSPQGFRSGPPGADRVSSVVRPDAERALPNGRTALAVSVQSPFRVNVELNDISTDATVVETSKPAADESDTELFPGDGPRAQLTAEQQAALDRFVEILDDERRRKLGELLRRPVVGKVIIEAVEDIPGDSLKSLRDISRYLVGQLIDVLHRPWDAAKAWLENLPVAMFCLLPFYALLLKVIYFRRRRFYSEHLVFGTHIHTVAYIVFTVLVVLPEGDFSDPLRPFLMLGLIVYYFLALKRYYGDGVFVTMFKFGMLLTLYSCLLGAALVGAAGGVLLFF